MTKQVISARGLSKRFLLGPRQPGYRTLRETLVDLARAPFAALRGNSTASDELWALDDVTFELRRGEILGIVGRNGAGKSTLLKLLARITEPTRGSATIHGRVSSLLEVGTGFHPELTGRENIYLNGAILGMKRREINTKFDEIAAFAQVERFLDTPVKRYSSGMYLRLAFAVAASLDSDVLLMDEILAVGDVGFQKKCMGKIDDVGKAGRSIIFVSHQLNQIRRLCTRCLWLDEGRLRMAGPTAEIVSAYEAEAANALVEARAVDEHSVARFVHWQLDSPRADQPNVLTTQGALRVTFTLNVSRPLRQARHGIALFSAEQQVMWATTVQDLAFEPGAWDLTYDLPGLPLRPGLYYWRASVFDDSGLLDVCDFQVGLNIATLPMTHATDDWAGVLNVPYELSTRMRP